MTTYANKATAAISFLVIISSASGEKKTSVTATNSQCKEILFNGKLSRHFSGQIEAAEENLAKLYDDMREFQLAAMHPALVDKAKAYQALFAATAVAAAKQEAALRSQAAQLREAADTLNRRIGAIQALLKTRPASLELKKGESFGAGTAVEGGKGALHQTPGSEKKCDTGLTWTPNSEAMCDSVAGEAGDIENAVSELNDLTVVPTTPDTAFHFPEITLSIRATGSAQSIAGTYVYEQGACLNQDARVHNAPDNVIGIAKPAYAAAAPAPTETPLTTSVGGVTSCQKPDEASKLIVNAQTAAAAICKGRQAKIPLETRPATLSTKQLMKDTTMQTIAFILTTGSSASDQKEDHKEAVVAALFGGGATDLSKTILVETANTRLSYLIGDAETKETTQTFAASENFGYAIAAAFMAKSSREETKDDSYKKTESGDKKENRKENDNKAAAENCTSHSTQDACIKVQNCKLENNACKDSSILLN